jgi:uncharacterized membrane protein YuzA (DUF378 family)
MKNLIWIAKILVLAAALDLGLIGAFGIDAIGVLLGGSLAARILCIAMGLSSVGLVYLNATGGKGKKK